MKTLIAKILDYPVIKHNEAFINVCTRNHELRKRIKNLERRLAATYDNEELVMLELLETKKILANRDPELYSYIQQEVVSKLAPR